MDNDNTNWGQSVTGVVIKDNKVLLARHNYGYGKNMLIVPGGYVMNNETPQNALRREFLEEVNINVEPKDLIAIRFNIHDWYIAFYAEYISGEPKSDGYENSEVLWVDVNEALEREDVPDLTKKLIGCALRRENGFEEISYKGNLKNGDYSLYGIK